MKNIKELATTQNAILAMSFVVLASFLFNGNGGEQGDIQADKSSDVSSDSGAVVDVLEKTLSVLPEKCRGCGKCVRADSEHFKINDSGIAEVLSQDNLDSLNLSAAISMCHYNAIELS